jgi:probable phosphoglycerate mutase
VTTFFLARHGAHDRLGRYLDGRRPGICLSADGRRQAEHLAERLARERIDHVFTSPIERARETAAPIAARLGLDLAVETALEEIDFGAWSGMSFDELQPSEHWQRWNSARATSRTPAGDTMRAAQNRMLDFIDRRRLAAPQAACVLVSHADPIKAAVVYYLGLSLNDLPRFEIAPASLTRIEIEPWGARVVTLNEVPA